MSIKINYDPKIQQLYDMPKQQGTEKSAKKVSGNMDQVNFSSTLQEAQQSHQSELSNAQRIAKVQSLKEQIASGEYNPDMQKVASSLLKHIIEVK
ncbi:MAG TPA: flagellar biosynthesis anti-sigma factor FlgM [Desulfohalobiaceae bacterium]|nr:flagellar biosynthesis anti-sigma factor FlgM [Desulfohalobiaceae bacterium]